MDIPRNFLDLLTAIRDGVTSNEQERFEELTDEAREIVRGANMRLTTRLESLQQAQINYAVLLEQFHASVIENAEDPWDDFETAYSKARRAEIIEARFTEAETRLNFELRDSIKAGVTQIKNH